MKTQKTHKKVPHHLLGKAIKSLPQIGPVGTSSLVHAQKNAKSPKKATNTMHGRKSPVGLR